MTETTQAGPHSEDRPLNHTTASLSEPTDIPAYPRGGDPRRRYHLRQLLVRRRRWSTALVVLLVDDELDLDAVDDDQDVDYWHVTGMTLGWAERDHAGRELAAIGWVP